MISKEFSRSLATVSASLCYMDAFLFAYYMFRSPRRNHQYNVDRIFFLICFIAHSFDTKAFLKNQVLSGLPISSRLAATWMGPAEVILSVRCMTAAFVLGLGFYERLNMERLVRHNKSISELFGSPCIKNTWFLYFGGAHIMYLGLVVRFYVRMLLRSVVLHFVWLAVVIYLT